MAVLIFAIGGGMSFYEGIKHIEHPKPLTDPLWNYVVLGIAIGFEGWACWLAVKALFQGNDDPTAGFWTILRRSKDPAVFASVLENLAALLGLVIALLGVYFGHAFNNPYLDGAASIAIGLLLVLVAIFLVSPTKGLLVGEGVDEETLAGLQEIARSQPEVEHISPPLTMYLGPQDVMMALDVEFRNELTAEQVEQAIDRLQDAIKAKYPYVQRIFVEAKAVSARERQAQA